MINHIIEISQFFDKVYIDDSETLNKTIQSLIYRTSNPANELIGYSDEHWDTYSKYFRMYDYEKIFVHTDEYDKDDIVLTVNALDINTQERFNFLIQFNDIIHHQTESNTKFLYDIFTIEVNKKVNSINDNIVVNNPKLNLKEIIGEHYDKK